MDAMRQFFLHNLVTAAYCLNGVAFAGEPLPIYQPTVKLADIYFHHPGAKPALRYNHDVDIVKFKGEVLRRVERQRVTRRGRAGPVQFSQRQ